MVMVHTIGTNVYNGSVGEEQLIALLAEVEAVHPGSVVHCAAIALLRRFVTIHGDLAVLRAVIDRLEAADFIE